MPHISYQDNEIADNNVDYFLIQINNLSKSTLDSAREIAIRINGELLLETHFASNTISFPFYCFENENVSSIDDLNFNELKKCQDPKSKSTYKYIVVFLSQTNGLNFVGFIKNKSPQQWHRKKPAISFELTDNCYIENKYYGTMLKVFHKQYQPEITNK